MKKKNAQKTFDNIQKKYSSISLNNTTSGSRRLIIAYSVFMFFDRHKYIFLFITSACFYFSDFNYQALSSNTKENGIEIYPEQNGTGGPDFTVLGGEFIHTDQNFKCNGAWEVGSGGVTTVYYSSSTRLGGKFQFDFIPTGEYAANLAFGRPDLYEIVLGDNSFEYISLKDLRSEDLVTLYNMKDVEDSSMRIRLANSLSTSSESTLRIEEVLTSKTNMIVRIIINGEKFESGNISVINQLRHKSLYLGLLDNDRNSLNNTGVVLSELKICN